MNSANKGIAIFIMFFAMFLIRQFVSYAVFPENTSPSMTLTSIARAVNAQCPKQVSKVLRLNKCIAQNKTEILYDFSLTNMSVSDLDEDQFESTMRKAILDNFRKDPKVQFFRDNRVTIEQIYRDKDNILVTTIVVKPEDYAD